MWQDVFSFDNLWLEKNGLYNSRTHELDERKIKMQLEVYSIIFR